MAIRLQPISRRSFFNRYALAASIAGLSKTRAIAELSQIAGAQPVALVDHPHGQYSFIRGISAYSAGVVARDGFEIVHATFSHLRPLEAGFRAIEEHLTAMKVARIALCGLELRSPLVLTSEEFRAFNNRYVELLRSWTILLEKDGNPVARTNVAPVLFPPQEPSIFGFSYVTPSSAKERTFIVAGGGELPDGSTNADDIIRRGEITPAALSEKARYVMNRMRARLRTLGVSWADVTTINVYTAHELDVKLVSEVLLEAGHNGVTWNYARPPIKDLEFEMDLRCIKNEIVLG